MGAFRESNLRAALKALSWRFVATAATIAIVYSFTGELAIAAAIGGIEVVLKLILYYLHERIWDVADLGRELR